MRALLTTVRRRPLWKLFVAFDADDKMREWVVWMAANSYYHCSTNGDSLVGWHVNHPDGHSTPAFYKAEQFRSQFHRPGVLAVLLNGRDVAEALTAAQKADPKPIDFGALEPAPVRIEPDAKTVGKDGVAVKLTVALRGRNPDLLPERVELWVNERRLRTWDAGGKPFAETVAVGADDLRAGPNVLTLLTLNPLGGRGEAAATVVKPGAARPPRLFGLFVGVDVYKGSEPFPGAASKPGDVALPRGKLNDLTSAVRDATALLEMWLKHRGAGRLFVPGDDPVILVNDAAEPDKVRAAFAELAKKAGPDDRVVVFFAGHGDYVPDAARPDDPAAGSFVFCGPGYDRAKAGTGLSAKEIADALAGVAGRKVVVLDACHAGAAATGHPVRGLVPAGQGPVVLAACDQSEQSYEHPKLGHGVFTRAVIEALGENLADADADGDGAVDPRELSDYVARRVPAILESIGLGRNVQVPQRFPPTPPTFAVARK